MKSKLDLKARFTFHLHEDIFTVQNQGIESLFLSQPVAPVQPPLLLLRHRAVVLVQQTGRGKFGVGGFIPLKIWQLRSSLQHLSDEFELDCKIS